MVATHEAVYQSPIKYKINSDLLLELISAADIPTIDEDAGPAKIDEYCSSLADRLSEAPQLRPF